MSALSNFVREHARATTAEEGSADLVFFKVAMIGNPDPTELRSLIRSHPGEYGDVDLFDGNEHSYLELGGWIGSQELALTLMGLGSLMKLWQLLTPKNMLGTHATPEVARTLAEKGLITISAEKSEPVQLH